jgi:hypothetical protein
LWRRNSTRGKTMCRLKSSGSSSMSISAPSALTPAVLQRTLHCSIA